MQGPGDAAEPARFRPSLTAGLVRHLPLLLAAVVAVVDRVTAPSGLGHGGFPLPIAVLLLLATVRWWREGTTLTAEGIEVSDWRTPRSIPWSRVQAIEVGHELVVLRVVAVLTQDGVTTRLRTPARPRWWTDRLDRDVDVLRRWWLAHRGPGWQPMDGNPWSRAGRAVDDPWRSPVPSGSTSTVPEHGSRESGG